MVGELERERILRRLAEWGSGHNADPGCGELGAMTFEMEIDLPVDQSVGEGSRISDTLEGAGKRGFTGRARPAAYRYP